MIVFPNAKINIGLHVVSRRPDGFRNLESCFYPVQWQDALEVVPASQTQLTLSGIPVPGATETNLCGQAYDLLRMDYNLPPVNMHLHKNIPIGAGMGGGSADGAFALQVLNNLFALNLAPEVLEGYARRLGSDCAFFIRNKPVFARERGDVFEPINLDLSSYQILIVYPNLHITTGEAFGLVKTEMPRYNLKKVLEQDITTWKDKVENSFEVALFPKYPVLPEIKAELYAQGAIYASMTGSGSAIYGIFPPGEIATEWAFPEAFRWWHGQL